MLEELIMQATDENDVDLEKLVELVLKDVKTIIMESETLEEAVEAIDHHFNLRELRLSKILGELIEAVIEVQEQHPKLKEIVKRATKVYYEC